MAKYPTLEQKQFDLDFGKAAIEESVPYDSSSTFVSNMRLPIHRWYRYSAGFSATWAASVIKHEKEQGRHHILDPFAGSGTVLLESQSSGVESIGVEAHPFIARVARAKLKWDMDAVRLHEFAMSMLDLAKSTQPNVEFYPALIKKCYPQETLKHLYTLWMAWEDKNDDSPYAELAWLGLASILRETSPVGTAQWQYVLPNKTKAKPTDPYDAFQAKLALMTADMVKRQRETHGPSATLYCEDARTCASVPDDWADLVITSPPYANNYDYADATRLEMSFFGDVQGWGDLQDAVRKHLVRSCTQHVAKQVGETYDFVNNPLLAPIRDELLAVCRQLETERNGHGGKKPYHTMIAAYFLDLAQVWHALRRVTRKGGSRICYVVGDSAPYGVYVPVDDWLGKLAVAAGFESYTFEKTRDRNIKWKNRKHRVPLHEGRLWING